MTQHTTIQALEQQLTDIEADIQAALNSLQARFVGAKIMTHRRRDRASNEGRPGFYREPLTIDKHVNAVMERADIEKTTGSLNHKNWTSIVHAFIDMGQGCVDDGNKIALRVDDLRNVLRMLHLLQEHLAVTANARTAITTTATQQATPAPQRAVPIVRKATRELTPTPATTQATNTPDDDLEPLPTFDQTTDEETEEPEGDQDDPDDDTDEETEELPRWREVS